jgi:Fe-S-cluster containining protein
VTECARCGACCERIYYSDTPEEIDHRAEGGEGIGEWSRYDAQFIRYYWRGADDGNGNIVYSCDAYDPIARTCMQHENRPQVCRGFPWYGDEPNAKAIRPFKHCSFWADLPRERWPEGVVPLPDPPVIAVCTEGATP